MTDGARTSNGLYSRPQGEIFLNRKISMQNEDSETTFREMAEEYLVTPTKFGSSRGENVEEVTRRMVARWGDFKLSDVEWNLEINSFIKELRDQGDRFCKSKPKKGYSAGFINKYLVALRRMFVLVTKSGKYKGALPVIEKPVEKVSKRYLSEKQVTAFCNQLNPLRASMYRFSFHTGLRNSNVRLLCWDRCDIDWEERTAVLEYDQSSMKNGEPLYIPLNEFAFDILEERFAIVKRLEQDHKTIIPWVFPSERTLKPYVRRSMTNHTVKSAASRAKIPPDRARMHAMRHAFASVHVKAGTTGNQLKEIGGWESIRSVERYAHLETNGKKAVLDKAATKV